LLIDFLTRKVSLSEIKYMNGTGHAEKNTKTRKPIAITTEAHESRLVNMCFKEIHEIYFSCSFVI
jgi:hypothetical protein